MDLNFKGSPFTWWNDSANEGCIFKRLDKVVVNQLFMNDIGQVDLKYLSRFGSDHAPLLLSCGASSDQFHKLFRFLNF